MDHPASVTADIVNQAAAGANTFQGNVCLTGVNAPCPAAVPPTLSASPNPIAVTGDARLGSTTLSWMAPGMESVEVRVGSPSGPLFGNGSRGSFETGDWVTDGMTFYLQDTSGGKPLTAENTLATVVVRLQRR